MPLLVFCRLGLLFLVILVVLPTYGQEQKYNEYTSLLSSYIKIPSETRNEKDAGVFFMQQCQDRGLYTQVLIKNDTAFNFIASVYPLACNKPNIVFLNHIDVVPPGDTTHWSYPPYSGSIIDSVIWGRGSIDNKGMAVAELFAVSSFVKKGKENDLPYNISILCVSGEETDGLTGAKPVSEKFLKLINPALIVGEGGSGVNGLIKADPKKTVFGISTVEKTKLTLDLTMNITASGHGSIPPKDYAMKEMVMALENLLSERPDIKYTSISARGLKELGKHEKGIKGFVQRHMTFLFFRRIVKKEIEKDPVLTALFAHTIAFTKLNAYDPIHNQITPQVTATLDCRLLPGTKPDKFIQYVRKSLKDERIDIKVSYQVLAAPRTKPKEFYSYLKEAITEVHPGSISVEIIFPATTDNSVFRDKGIPVLGIFPACFEKEELESIHNINERIHFNRLDAAVLVYQNFLERIQKVKLTEFSTAGK
jgi:carboxypeptidase PM20D1